MIMPMPIPIKCLNELTFTKSMNTCNNYPSQQLHLRPRHEPLPATQRINTKYSRIYYITYL